MEIQGKEYYGIITEGEPPNVSQYLKKRWDLPLREWIKMALSFYIMFFSSCETDCPREFVFRFSLLNPSHHRFQTEYSVKAGKFMKKRNLSRNILITVLSYSRNAAKNMLQEEDRERGGANTPTKKTSIGGTPKESAKRGPRFESRRKISRRNSENGDEDESDSEPAKKIHLREFDDRLKIHTNLKLIVQIVWNF